MADDDLRDQDRLRSPLDAVLHLLDRQIIDRDGRLVGKVDDVELSEEADGTLRVSGLLLGTPALLPRFGSGRVGPWLLEAWRTLGVTRSDRMVPGRIDVADVDCLTSEVRLTRSRDGVVAPQPQAPGEVVLRRVGDLMDMGVRFRDRDPLRIQDVRLEPSQGLGHERVVAVALVVGRGRPGSMLGYDRRAATGPLPVAWLVRRLHRHTGLLPLDRVVRIDWERREVDADGALDDLAHPRSSS